jgi:ABC-2 type transport system permease protein
MTVAPIAARQARVEVLQFLRSRPQVVFTIGFPVVLLIVLGSIFKGHLPAGVTFTQYFVTGMIASGLMASGFQALAIQIPIERDKGVLKRLRGTPMPPAVYFLGKIGMVAFIAVLETVVLLAIGLAFLDVSLPSTATQWLTLLWVGVLGTMACTLCGIAFSSASGTGRSAPAIVTPVAIVLQFISGVFFVYTDLPPWMRQVAALFPLKWMCQGMRSVFLPPGFAQYEAAGSWELGRVALVLGAWCVGGLILCLTTFRWTARQ